MLSDRFRQIHERLLEDVFSEPKVRVIEAALVRAARDERVASLSPEIAPALARYEAASGDEREIALLELYGRIHRAGSEYAPTEQERMRALSGIDNLPGGLTPILMAAEVIRPGGTFVDLGAGSGLQGLLLQLIAPHAATIQLELSGRMIDAGRAIQAALGIDGQRVRWVHGDMLLYKFEDEADVAYLYRPVKPHAGGNALYDEVARRLSVSKRVSYVISVADCLGPRLTRGGQYVELYRNEYLACYGRATSRPKA